MAGRVVRTLCVQWHYALFPPGIGLWAHGDRLLAVTVSRWRWSSLILALIAFRADVQLNLKRTNYDCWYLDRVR